MALLNKWRYVRLYLQAVFGAQIISILLLQEPLAVLIWFKFAFEFENLHLIHFKTSQLNELFDNENMCELCTRTFYPQ